jgi:hypothetical protein
MKLNIIYLTCLLLSGVSQAALSQRFDESNARKCTDCFPEGGGGSGSGGIAIPTCSTLPNGQILYVDQSKASSGTGLSWSQALTSLSTALQYASDCEKVKEIRVARGTYKPSTLASAAGRKHTFFIGTELKLTGGYPSGGGAYNPALNPTILDGDLGGGHRSYHVLVISGTYLAKPVTIDGFRIRNGAADGFGFINLGTENDPIYISDHSGSAAFVSEAFVVTFRNCAIYQNGNANVEKGGAIYSNGSNIIIQNSVIAGNTGTLGGGISADGVGPFIHAVNSTFYGNTGESGGASYNHLTSSMKFTNCIVWGNSSAWGGSGYRQAEYSVMQEASPGVGNQVVDPQFSNPSNLNGADDQWFTQDDGLSLKSCSPAINRGSNGAISSFSLDKDITGDDRIQHVTVDAGAYEYDFVPQPGAASSLAGVDEALLPDVNTFVYGGPTVIHKNCKILATITPSGARPVSGPIVAHVYTSTDGAPPQFEGKPFVRRHYHLHPLNGGDEATATVTLYFTQAEFDAYNKAVGDKRPNLPKNSTDTDGNKSNLLITQFHGNPNDQPGRPPQAYTGDHLKFFPKPENIKWHPGRSIGPNDPPVGYWSVTFPVNGFSGFFVSAEIDDALPVTLHSFEAKPENTGVVLSWETTSESQSSHFVIQRGTNEKNLTDIGKVAASGESTALQSYRFTDTAPASLSSKPIYYRLKCVDLDGTYSYSQIRSVARPPASRNDLVTLLGNPVSGDLRFRFNALSEDTLTLRLTNISGRIVRTTSTQVSPGLQDFSLDISMYPDGLYLVDLSLGTERKIFRIVK